MNDKYIQLDAKEVERQIARLFTDFHDELADDDALRADLVEGESDLHSILRRILDHRTEAEFLIAGIKERAAHLKERQDRYARRKDAMTALALRLMIVAQQDKVVLPEATISVSKGRERVEITDEDSVPRQLGKTTWAPDKVAIRAQLDAGEIVPGASIAIGPDSLGVRLK